MGKVSPHPVWEVACNPVVKGRVALLGDVGHMASPHTGAGAYTAMVDAHVFGKPIQEGSSLHDALDLYNINFFIRCGVYHYPFATVLKVLIHLLWSNSLAHNLPMKRMYSRI
jgi:flavin-dependent dehydrogenase